MKDIIIDSVKKLERLLEHSGCEDVGVLLEVNPDAVNCQYERGACMSATFGGRSADFVTCDPIRARTKISFMFDASLDTPKVRGAACVIINVAAGFFCLSRVLHACPRSSHDSCTGQLIQELAGKKVWCVGSITSVESDSRYTPATSADDADIIVIGGDGIISEGTGDLIENSRKKKRIICIGPSTAGVARLNEIEHWCPFGKR